MVRMTVKKEKKEIWVNQAIFIMDEAGNVTEEIPIDIRITIKNTISEENELRLVRLAKRDLNKTIVLNYPAKQIIPKKPWWKFW